MLDEIIHNKAGEAMLGNAACDEVGETMLFKIYARIGMWQRRIDAASPISYTLYTIIEEQSNTAIIEEPFHILDEQ